MRVNLSEEKIKKRNAHIRNKSMPDTDKERK